MTQKRDSHGRFKADHHQRNIAIGAATAIGAIATGLASAIHFGLFDRLFPDKDGHRAPDLEGDNHPGPRDRAPDHFRPDPTAPVSASDREALRPATSPVQNAGGGDMRSEPA